MGKKFTTTEGLTTTLYSPEAFGSLSPSEASEQILTTFKTAKHKYPPAKYQYPPDIEKSVTDLVEKISSHGQYEFNHEAICKQANDTIDKILRDDNEKLGPHIGEICRILEETAPTPESREALQAALAPTKVQYMQKAQEKILKVTLDLVEQEIMEFGTNQNPELRNYIRNNMGNANADKFANMAQKMGDRLKGVTNQSKRAGILVEEIGKMQKFVKNTEKQAGKGKFGKVINVLKSALKVIGTLGLNKNAKLEFAAAKFAMNNKNAEKIKSASKKLSPYIDASKGVAIAAKNTNKGRGR